MAGTRFERMAIDRERSIAKTVADAPGGLVLLDLEVLGQQPDRRPGALSQDGVSQRARQVQADRLAGRPGPRRLLAVAAARQARLAVRAERRRVAQLGEQVAQRAEPDLAHALGAQREATARAVHEPLVAQPAHRALEALDVARGVVAQVAPHGLHVDLGQLLGGARAS